MEHYLKRYNLNPLIIAKDNGALDEASSIDNYYKYIFSYLIHLLCF